MGNPIDINATNLLKAVKNNEHGDIELLLKINKTLLDYQYGNKTILILACSNDSGTIKADTVEVLIKHGANVAFSEASYHNYTALHFAAMYSRSDLIETIIRLRPESINFITEDGNNALHTLIEHSSENKTGFQIGLCAVMLINRGINVNKLNNKGKSPIYLAAEKDHRLLVKKILETGINVNLNTKVKTNKDDCTATALELIEKNELCNWTLLLYDLLDNKKQDQFITLRNGDIKDFVNKDNSPHTLLQLSCKNNLVTAAWHLLANGADPYRTTEKNTYLPIEIAAKHGYFKLFEPLLNKYKPVPHNVLLLILTGINTKSNDSVNYEKCYNSLLNTLQDNHELIDANYLDENNKNVLDYVIQYGNKEQITQFVKLGLSLPVVKWNAFMNPNLLEKHLDECIEYDLNSKTIEKEVPKVRFNMSTLVRPFVIFSTSKYAYKNKGIVKYDLELQNLLNNSEITGIDNGVKTDLLDYGAQPETDKFLFLSKSSEYNHLFKHPVIVTFLLLKWHKIQWLYFTNIAFYFTFFLMLIFYIANSYTNFQNYPEISPNSAYNGFDYILLCITFEGLLVRELFQITVLRKTYFINFENLLEILLIIVTGFILMIKFDSEDARKLLSIISTFLAAIGLILLFGKHPKLLTNMENLHEMFVKILKLILWFLVVTVAIVLNFYIMFTNTKQEDAGQMELQFKNKQLSYVNLDQSFFQTNIMAIIKSNTSDKIIFFIYFITSIILINFLIDLVANDNKINKNVSEVMKNIARVEYMNYIEHMLFGSMLFSSNLLCYVVCRCTIVFQTFEDCLKGDHSLQCKADVKMHSGRIIKLYPKGWFANLHLDEASIKETKKIIEQRKVEWLKN